jgi:hypothetical protein
MNGQQPDPIEMLFSDAGMEATEVHMGDVMPLAFANATEQLPEYDKEKQVLKFLLPEGMRDLMSVDTTKHITFSSDGYGLNKYRAQIRGMCTKLPGFLMTSYRAAEFRSPVAMSEEQFAYITQQHLEHVPAALAELEKLNDEYQWSNKVPKRYLFVKLAEGTDPVRRNFIANGIRATFKSELIILVDIKEQVQMIRSSMAILQVLTGLIGCISLTIAFFLLLVATTSNIRESIQEYGCLRAIGLSVSQGTRLFFYEQYAVIIAALLLGAGVGLALASVVTAQFYLFLEMPWKLVVPQALIWSMVVLALGTTGYAVYTPVMQVNRKKISSTIKGLD